MKYIYFSILIITIAIIVFIDPKANAAPSFKVGDRVLSEIDYNALKSSLAVKVDSIKTKPLTPEDAKDWVDVVNLEINKCVLTDITQDNIVQKINNCIK